MQGRTQIPIPGRKETKSGFYFIGQSGKGNSLRVFDCLMVSTGNIRVPNRMQSMKPSLQHQSFCDHKILSFEEFVWNFWGNWVSSLKHFFKT